MPPVLVLVLLLPLLRDRLVLVPRLLDRLE